MQSRLPRSIDEFKDEGVIVGRGHISRKVNHHYDKFYTIDVCEDVQPDLVRSITDDLPVNCYNLYNTFNDELTYKFNAISEKGFKNLFSMTSEDGFILIIGCRRAQHERLFLRNYNYIELSDPSILPVTEDKNIQEYNKAQAACLVLIPKNQSLTIEEVTSQINQCDILSAYLNIYKHGELSIDPVFFNNKKFFSEVKASVRYVTKVMPNLEFALDKITRQPSPVLTKILEEENWIANNKPSNTILYVGAALCFGIFAYRYCHASSASPSVIMKPGQ